MKIKGFEIGNYGVFVRDSVNVENYLAGFNNANPIEIMLVSENTGGHKVGEYDIFCENRKVAAKVLKKVKEDLQDGFFELEFKNYSDFILNSVAGDIVVIIVFDPTTGHSKFFNIETGRNLPF